jgi:hypothetical protein
VNEHRRRRTATGDTGVFRRDGDSWSIEFRGRALSRISRAIKSAQRRLTELHPELAGHLSATIRCGNLCCYLPDPRSPIRWNT